MPISFERLDAEVRQMLRRGGIDPSKAVVSLSEREDRDHAENRRRYASVDVNRLNFGFARATLELDDEHRQGLIAHEVGHVLAWRHWRDGSEDGADVAACEFLDVTICYDMDWPGKGLQGDCGPCAVTARRANISVNPVALARRLARGQCR